MIFFLRIFLIAIIFFLLIACSIVSAEQYKYPDLDINSNNLKSHVEFLTNIRPYVNYLNIQSMDKAAAYIKDNFEEYGLETKEQRFEVHGKEYKNIIGTINIENPIRIIVGAHYDVCGDQPGADDNASAIAGLLEVARITKQYASELNYRVDFVAYALEEPPFFGTEDMGSYLHAKGLHERGINIRGMICLEMIGYFTEEEDTQEYPVSLMKLFYPKTGNFIGIVGNFSSSSLVKEIKKHMKVASINVESLKAPSWIVGVDFSDHRNYWKFDYEAVMITDTSFYRNPNYHKISDTMDTLNFEKMGEVVRGICWSLINLE
jgi:hypothetical protein